MVDLEAPVDENLATEDLVTEDLVTEDLAALQAVDPVDPVVLLVQGDVALAEETLVAVTLEVDRAALHPNQERSCRRSWKSH